MTKIIAPATDPNAHYTSATLTAEIVRMRQMLGVLAQAAYFLVLEIERCDNPSDMGVGAHDPMVEHVREVIKQAEALLT